MQGDEVRAKQRQEGGGSRARQGSPGGKQPGPGEERNRPGGGGPWCRGAQGQDVGGDQVGSPSVACRAVGRVD